MIALLLGLGCVGADRWDGTWLFSLGFSQDTCDPENTEVGAEQTLVGSLWRTEDHNLVVRLGEADPAPLLVGPYEGDVFSASLESSTDYAGICDVDRIGYALRMEGRLEGDGGLAGTLDVSTRREVSGCGGGDDVAETCTNHWSVSGTRLDADGSALAHGSHWGYFAGPIGY